MPDFPQFISFQISFHSMNCLSLLHSPFVFVGEFLVSKNFFMFINLVFIQTSFSWEESFPENIIRTKTCLWAKYFHQTSKSTMPTSFGPPFWSLNYWPCHSSPPWIDSRIRWVCILILKLKEKLFNLYCHQTNEIFINRRLSIKITSICWISLYNLSKFMFLVSRYL